MTPRKRGKRERSQSPPPIRKSARLLNQTVDRAGSAASGISAISDNIDLSSDWTQEKQIAQDRIKRYVPDNRQDEAFLAPLLTACLEFLPQGGKEPLIVDIKEAETDETLWQQFHNLLTCLLYPMRARSGKGSITSSPHSRRKSNAEIVASTLDQLQTRIDKFRTECLHRDDMRCVVTKSIETEYWEKNLGSPENLGCSDLEVAHIIPFAYASWDRSMAPPSEMKDIWETLFRCFPAVRKAKIRIETINDNMNGITLSGPIRQEFGKFRLAFQATNSPNVYSLKVYRTFTTYLKKVLPKDLTVKFEKADGAEHIPLPHPSLLDCHYRVSEILNASGMGDFIEKKIKEQGYYREDRMQGNLQSDGSTDISVIMQNALWPFVVAR